MSYKLLLQLAFAAVITGSAVTAGPITYTMTATATGTLAGTPFTNAAITVTSVADTTQVFVSGGTSPDLNYEIIPASSTISIAGFPTATFTDPTFWLDPNGSGDIIFGDTAAGGSFGGILGFTNLPAALEFYNLESSFGPVLSPLDFETTFFDAFQNISTSDGSLSLVASNDTFTAVAAAAAVPEPSSFLMAGLGMLGALVIRVTFIGDKK